MKCKCKEPFFRGYDDAPESIVCVSCGKKPEKKVLEDLLNQNEKAKKKNKSKLQRRMKSRKKSKKVPFKP